MQINIHKEHFADTGEEIQAFEIHTRKGYAYGFYHNNTLCIHHIGGEGSVKGIMNSLCKQFNTNKFRFLMVINPALKNIIHGRVVKIPANAKDNPFGEELEEIHGEWGNFTPNGVVELSLTGSPDGSPKLPSATSVN